MLRFDRYEILEYRRGNTIGIISFVFGKNSKLYL